MNTLALIYQPFFPALAIALAVGAAALLAGWAWTRCRGASPFAANLGLAMRLLAIAAIGLLLLGPSTLPPQDIDPTRTTVHFLIDASGSMQTHDAPAPGSPPGNFGAEASSSLGNGAGDNLSRYAFALKHWLSPERLALLNKHHTVRVYSFGDRVRATLPPENQATHRASNLIESTYELLTTMNQKRQEDSEGNSEGGSGEISGGGVVVVLSDGRDSRGAKPTPATQLAVARGIKVHTVTLGGATLSRDLALTATPRQPYLMLNEPGQIDVRLEHINANGMATTLRIRHNGKETTRPIAFDQSPRQTIELPIEHPESGLYAYEISIDPVAGEPEANNNNQTVFIEVTGQRMRVLVLEGQPYWDTKFLAQSLRKDDRVELTQITQIRRDMTRPETIVTRVDETPKMPQSFEDLARYDVIILGRGMENVLPIGAAEALPRYVSERGGRVVLARGRPYDLGSEAGRAMAEAMSVIEPVVWGTGRQQNQPLTLTDAGRSHPLFARLMQVTHDAPGERDLPRFINAPTIKRIKPATRVLATAPNASNVGDKTSPENSPGNFPGNSDAATGGGEETSGRIFGGGSGGASGEGSGVGSGVVVMPYGRGMVVGILGEGMWRWSLAASENEALLGVFDDFWSTMVRWLVLGADAGPGKDVSLRLSSRSVALDDELTVTVVLRGSAAGSVPRVVVVDPKGKTTELTLTAYAGSASRRVGAFLPETVGVHTLIVTPPGSAPGNIAGGATGSHAERTSRNPSGTSSSDRAAAGDATKNKVNPKVFEPLETKFTAYDGNTEMLRTAADPVVMAALATATGGRVFDPQKPEALLEVLAVERASRFVPPSPRFVWDRGWVMAMLLGWVGLEWLVRKKGGLL